MGCQVSEIEQKILAAVQHGLPLSQNPYNELAEKIGIETEKLLSILIKWKQEGKIRRIGAIVNHLRTGSSAGAMVVWQVEPDNIEQIGQLFAGFTEVSHAYQRKIYESWPFNIYTMVHGRDEQSVEDTIESMSKASRISNYRVLRTKKELKKVPPTYIADLNEINKL